MRSVINNSRGFTLVELVVGMAITVILLGAIFGILATSLKTQGYGFSQEGNYNHGRSIINTVSDELRYATGISTVENQTTYTHYASGENRTIARGTGGNAGNIYVTRGSGTQVIGGGLVQDFTINRDDSNTKKIIITVEVSSQNAGITATNTFTTAVWTEN